MKTQLILFAASTALVTACGGQNPVSALVDNEFAGQIDELGQIIDEMQGSASFSKDLVAVTSKSSKDFVAKITTSLSDEPFELGGVTFSNVKSKIAAKSKIMTSLPGKISKVYKSPAGLFAAHGLGQKISRAELADYFRVAKAGLTSLTTGNSAGDQFDSLAIARALHVAAALSTVSKGSKAALALAEEKFVFTGRFSTCGQASNVAKKKDYICAKDDVSGSIGYMSSDRTKWIDGVTGKEFKACDKGAKFIKDGWGWMPDPKNPKGGVSCHVNIQGNEMQYYKEEVSEICGDDAAKKTNKDFCEKNKNVTKSINDPEPSSKDDSKKPETGAEAKTDK